jgi:hypothetical protein
LYEIAVRDDLDIAVCKYDVYNDKKSRFETTPEAEFSSIFADGKVSSKSEYPDEILMSTIGSAWNKIFRREFVECFYVGLVDRLCRAAAGIAGEELKYVRADGNGGLSHCEIAAGGGKMTPYFEIHSKPTFQRQKPAKSTVERNGWSYSDFSFEPATISRALTPQMQSS